MGIIKRYQKSREKVSAYNAWQPDFYNIAINGKSSYIVFPDDNAKNYYIKCMQAMLADMAVEILAYTIVTSNAYFVVASWDQTPVSLRRYFVAVNKQYSRFFDINYLQLDYAFEDKIGIKKISSNTMLFQSIATVHAQAYTRGLSKGFNDYPYHSYKGVSINGKSNIDVLKSIFGEEKAVLAYESAHLEYPIIQELLPDKEKVNFIYSLEDALIKYKCFEKRAIPADILRDVLIDLNEKGSYTLAYMLHELMIKPSYHYDILLTVVTELVLRYKRTYDEALDMLGVAINNNTLIKDIVIAINSQKFFSYKVIMQMMGLNYPNLEFLVELIREYSQREGLPYADTIEKLGIYQKDDIDSIIKKLGK